MSLIKLHDALAGITHFGIDTDCVIYFVQANPLFAPLVSEVFRKISTGQLNGVTSSITLTETLILPIRTGNALLQQEFRDLLLHSQNFDTLPVSTAIAERAAEIRAFYRLKTPDAIQAATALETGCDAFLTNNGEDFRRVTILNVVVLNELEL